MFDKKTLLQHMYNHDINTRDLRESRWQVLGLGGGGFGPGDPGAPMQGHEGHPADNPKPTGFALTEIGVVISNPEHAKKIGADRFIHVDEVKGIDHLHDYAVGDGVKDTHKTALDKHFTKQLGW